jgi:pseudouridine-5'-phosphate glycosidase
VNEALAIAPEVREALAAGRPVVALETSVVAQGLPPPANLDAARRSAAAVRAAGAVPAHVAVLSGRVRVGLDEDALARLADLSRPAAKAGVRDLAPLVAARRDAGTTVSATCAIAALAGIRVFATGGIGGVHRTAPGEGSAARDVSSDLAEIARRPVCVVSSGPKAILDVPATAEALESLGVPVLGFGTSELPAFYADRSGVPLEHRVETAADAARVLHVHWDVLGRGEGVLLCVPPPAPVPASAVEGALSAALADAFARAIGGKGLTPFLLAALDRATGGASRAANVALLEANARVAGEVAAALAAGGSPWTP